MSKLSKFKYRISTSEAEDLLSRLIEEDVTSDDLETMYRNEWITASYDCSATLVKLRQMLEPEQHAKQVAVGRYYMEAEDDCGICVSYNLPLDEVDIGHGRAYVLRDEDGGYYAIRDNSTKEYICEDDRPFFEDALIEPQEIYELAGLANNDMQVATPKIRTKQNESCICINGTKIYNFQPGHDRLTAQKVPIEIRHSQDPPSFVLVVAALIEIATNGETKSRNQSSLIGEIQNNYKFRGLSQSNLEKIFSQANRQLAEAIAAKD